MTVGVAESRRSLRLKDAGRPPRRFMFPFEMFVWLIIGLGVVLFLNTQHLEMLTVFSVLGLAHSSLSFFRIGGARVTAGGVFLVGTGVFVFYPAILMATQGAPIALDAASDAVGWAFFSQVIMTGLWWNAPATTERQVIEASPTGPRGVTASLVIGVLFIGAGIAVEVLNLGAGPFAAASSYTGVVLMSVSALSGGKRVTLPRLIVVLGSAGLYVAFMFSGGGRLVLGTLAVAILLVMNMYRPRLWHKMATLIALPVGLALLAEHRSDAVAARSGLTETGLESVLSPFQRFAELLQMAHAGDLVYSWGETFIAPVVFFVPRALWPEKPIGFGAELTLLFRPELAAVGHSEAALIYGEFVYNFGIIGLIALVPIMGYLIKYADRLLAYSHRRGTTDLRGVLVRVSAALIGAGILDLVWVGAFGVSGRTGIRLLLVLALFLLFANAGKRRQRA